MQEGKALLNMADDKEKVKDGKEKPRAVKDKVKADKGDNAVKTSKKSTRPKTSTKTQPPGENGSTQPGARPQGAGKGTPAAAPKAAVVPTSKAQSILLDIKKYLKGVMAEYHRVTWPTKQELRAATIVVVAILVIVTFYLFVVNSVLNVAFEKMVS